MVVKSAMDIISTIEDDEVVENLSEDSEVEIEVSFWSNAKNLYQHRVSPSVSTIKTKTPEKGALREWIPVCVFSFGVQQRYMGRFDEVREEAHKRNGWRQN
jgi:hypothetical protein